MTRQMLAIFLLALVWFEPTALPAATKLTIGHSTINPRISPLWIAQEKGYFFTGVDIVTTRGFIAEQSLLIENMLKALMESLAYLIAPKNEAAVVELIMRNYASKALSPLKKATMT